MVVRVGMNGPLAPCAAGMMPALTERYPVSGAPGVIVLRPDPVARNPFVVPSGRAPIAGHPDMSMARWRYGLVALRRGTEGEIDADPAEVYRYVGRLRWCSAEADADRGTGCQDELVVLHGFLLVAANEKPLASLK